MRSGWRNFFWRVRKFLPLLVLLAGCASTTPVLELDAKDPSIEVKTTGFYVNDQPTTPKRILAALTDLEVPKTRTIYIRIDDNVTNLTPARSLMGYLAKNGYTRPVLVTKRHAESEAHDKKKPWR